MTFSALKALKQLRSVADQAVCRSCVHACGPFGPFGEAHLVPDVPYNDRYQKNNTAQDCDIVVAVVVHVVRVVRVAGAYTAEEQAKEQNLGTGATRASTTSARTH